MLKIERAMKKIMSRTEERKVNWQPDDKTGFVANVNGKDVQIFPDGMIKIENWTFQSEIGVKLYKAARRSARPDWVDDWIKKVAYSGESETEEDGRSYWTKENVKYDDWIEETNRLAKEEFDWDIHLDPEHSRWRDKYEEGATPREAIFIGQD